MKLPIYLAAISLSLIIAQGVSFSDEPESAEPTHSKDVKKSGPSTGRPRLGRLRPRPGTVTPPPGEAGGDHGHGGAVVEVKCAANDKPMTAKQKEIMVKMMTKRSVRLGHSLWHVGSSGMHDQNTDSAVGAFGKDWLQKDKVCPYPAPSSEKTGESFLYKHHMLRMALFSEFRANKPTGDEACVGGWTKIPDGNDFPVPMGPNGGGGPQGPKSPQALKIMQEWLRMFKNKFWLRDHSLGQMGWLVEKTIHNNMHMRWADEKVGAQFDTNFPLNKKFMTDANYPPGWNADSPTNDYLGDPYGSHVNPIFWKLHGMIDDLVAAWGDAQKDKITQFGTAANPCPKTTDAAKHCYPWKGVWVGGDIPEPKAPVVAAAAQRGFEAAAPKKRTIINEHFTKHGLDEALIRELSQHEESHAKSFAAASPREVHPQTGEALSPEDKKALKEYEENKVKWQNMVNTMEQRWCQS